ncbi:hypothetical protein Q8W15_17270 [Photobacterium damselae subsp. piscicida]|nr:hypothetical protein [Photobacterium damselae subsp. piscicida]MDP2568235.1 hypothetical protein [Photobacterium damselae subsp. piscicida]
MSSAVLQVLQSPFTYTNWQRYVKSQKRYIEEVLKPTLASGDWDAINELPILIGNDGVPLIKFKDNIWPLKEHLLSSKFDDHTLTTLHFYAYEMGGAQVDIGTALPRRMRDELKCFMLSEMYLVKSPAKNLSTLRTTLNPLKSLAMEASDFGLSSLADVSVRAMKEMLNLDYVELQQQSLRSLNKFSRVKGMPFEFSHADAGKFTEGTFPETKKFRENEQYCVIPLSIYKTLFHVTENLLEKYYPVRNELADKIRHCQRLQEEAIARNIKAFRSGEVGIKAYFNAKPVEEIERRFKEAEIPIADFFETGDQWLNLWNDIDPSWKGLNIKAHKKYKAYEREAYNLEISKQRWQNLSQFKNTLSEIDAACRFLIMALTGMRGDELYRMHPTYGLQTTTIKGQIIHLVTTRQSKISRGQNTVNDVYVTTATGAKAYQLLNAIHSPLREKFKTDKHRFFGGFRGLLKSHPQQKDSDNIDKWVGKWIKEQPLTREDISQLNMSNPDRTTNVEVGKVYHFSPHQLRRSLAYYLIGYELLSYPQLKQQFSHFSLAMTRWYARYADSFAKMQREIEAERLDQQSEIMARIYNKIANKERIGGGKAKVVADNMAKNGKSYYEEGSGDRVLSKAYWKRILKNRTQHLHAIAPNMYCTNGGALCE